MSSCPDLSSDSVLAAIVCSCENSPIGISTQLLSAVKDICPVNTCYAICSNADVGGIGVRVALYAQSIINALLVFYSPKDSLSSAWASAFLVIALIVPAITQKAQGNLTLHHATLVFNFATLSCISSLAVAPKLHIWRLDPSPSVSHGQAQQAKQATNTVHSNEAKKDSRKRLILSLALLLQVVLQWSWGVFLFVSPSYSQSECNNQTKLRLFFVRMTAEDVNSHRFYIWVLWLVFCMFLTLFWTVALAFSGAIQAHESSRSLRRSDAARPPVSSAGHCATSKRRRCFNGLLAWHDSPYLPLNYVAAFSIWLAFVIASEQQRTDNCIFPGEETLSSFGQLAALLLTVQPLWSLTVALYDYPKLVQTSKKEKQFDEAAKPLQNRVLNTRGAQMPESRSNSAAGPSQSRSNTLPIIPEDIIPHDMNLGVLCGEPDDIHELEGFRDDKADFTATKYALTREGDGKTDSFGDIANPPAAFGGHPGDGHQT